MNDDFQSLKTFLRREVNGKAFDNSYNLYKAFIIAEKDGKQSKHDPSGYTKFIYECIYRYNKTHGIGNLINHGNKLPFLLERDISFEDFCNKMSEYNRIPFINDIIPNDNYRSFLARSMGWKLRTNGNSDWYSINSQTIDNRSLESKEYSRKIYLSVDNKDLHNFSVELLDKCSELGIDYDFKINGQDAYRRYDNVVIYCSDSEFVKYIQAIEEIKSENTNMDFGEAHLLSYHYNEYIGVAPMEKKGSTESHSEQLCEKIYELREEAEDFEEFYKDVKNLISESLETTKEFCENIRNKEFSDIKRETSNFEMKKPL
jgi:hypothetical protein